MPAQNTPRAHVAQGLQVNSLRVNDSYDKKNENIGSALILSGNKTVAIATAQWLSFYTLLDVYQYFEVHCSNISKLYVVICLPLKPLMTSPIF